MDRTPQQNWQKEDNIEKVWNASAFQGWLSCILQLPSFETMQRELDIFGLLSGEKISNPLPCHPCLNGM